MNKNYLRKIISISMSIYMLTFSTIKPPSIEAFPIYAQQGYENPRETTGRIACANCHLAQKPISFEIPKSVLPNSIFEAKVTIPYDLSKQQILSNGTKGDLNVGAVLILPEGFKVAPKKLLSNELKTKTKKAYVQAYSKTKENILVVGPIPGKDNQEITFPILSPDPKKDKSVHFLKYSVYVGGNRGRGQIYPTGDKSNNNLITASYEGRVEKLNELTNGDFTIEILRNNGEIYQEKISKGLEIKVKEGDTVKNNENLVNDPNIGGFGQAETEIVLQSPNRIIGMIAFFMSVTLAQIFFIMKKKQWEKVQSADLNI
uniref:Cytochrome f n=1 Tax=Platysiphonia delicata TaxID=2006979 RepID=A0A1Z1M0I5_9FLOR|nr:Apocytochrome f [Platysiphonia delicata]ARW59598.1 Apocytochrome f [Platysiphonia delicata]